MSLVTVIKRAALTRELNQAEFDQNMEAIIQLQSLYFSLGRAADSLKLGGNLPEHFATQQDLAQAIADLLASSPETLDTLQELAIALGNDPNFATTVSTALGNRLRFDISNQNLTTAQKINALTNLGIPEITIQGAIVEVKNKTDLENFEVGDRFRMSPTGRYVVGEVLAVPLNLPADLDNATKVKLYIDA